MTIERRYFLQGAGLIAAGAAALPLRAFASGSPPVNNAFVPHLGPRSRVLVVNDLSGDPDGLYSTVHALLSPSAQVVGIVGTAATLAMGETAEKSARIADEILALMGLTGKVPTFVGAPGPLPASGEPLRSPGTAAIIAEAMRTDTALPLFVTVGAGLTEVASALMLEPRIAGKFTLVWIGGNPAGSTAPAEYNFNVDRRAAQYVFNDTAVPIWQVTSGVYATCLVSLSEIKAYVAPYGKIGPWLLQQSQALSGKLAGFKFNTGETWILGDSPLVQLTALSDWLPSAIPPPFRFERTGSSQFAEIVAPRLLPGGSYEPRSEGRKIRVYTSIDTRTMFGDFFAKMRLNYAP